MQENPMQLKINKQAKFPSSIQNECKKKKRENENEKFGVCKRQQKKSWKEERNCNVTLSRTIH